jgi:hypothetical protein
MLFERVQWVPSMHLAYQAEGGHPVLLSLGKHDTRVQVHFTDITMWTKELGVDYIPESHPEVSKFQSGWPYSCKSYNLVICDGQALRKQEVAEYRGHSEQIVNKLASQMHNLPSDFRGLGKGGL